MDKIFAGLVRSTKPEQEKREVIRLIVATGKKKQSLELTLNMFESTTQVLVKGSSGFQWDAAKQVYIAWGRSNKVALKQYFTPELMHYLLDENFPNQFNAVWVIHESILELREFSECYNEFCDILQQKATTFIRTHPAFSTVVAFCKMLREFREGIPRGVMTPLFCNTLIDVVSTYTIQSSGCEHVLDFIQNMSHVIGDLLGHIWQKCNEETMWRSLKHTFELIKLGDNGREGKSPSVALAAVVQHFPTHSIPRALRSLLQDPSVHTSEIRIALDRMISWLQWPGAQNIHLWVNGFLHELSQAQRNYVLIDVTECSVEKVFKNCSFKPIRENSLAVLTAMLMGYKHSPLAFHKIADSVPALVESLLQEDSPEARSFLKELNMLVQCMMHLFPGFPEIYEPILTSTQDVDSPSLHTIEERLRERGWVVANYGGTQPMSSPASMMQQLSDKRGLENLGNTCFMNSIIQALFMCDSFREAVLIASVGAAERIKAKLQRAFAFLLISERPCIDPRELLSIIPAWFEQGAQQDCSEFLKYVLDQMHEQEKRSNTQEKHISIIQQLFLGKIENTYTCLKCGQKSVKLESFYDLSLAFPKSKSTPKLSRDSKKDSVEHLLEHHLEPEKLQGDNKYRCDKCKNLQDAKRTMNIVEAPNFLFLTLMRFSYDVRTQRRSKICTDVHYPKELMLPVADPTPSSGSTNGPSQAHTEHYALVGVVVHSGYSLDAGHYYTYARSSSDTHDAGERWFQFNDHRVSRTTYASFSGRQKTFARDTPYVLVYHKVGSDGGATANNKFKIREDLHQLVQQDNARYMQEVEQAKRRQAMAESVRPWPWGNDRDDHNPPPGPGAGLGGPRLVF